MLRGVPMIDLLVKTFIKNCDDVQDPAVRQRYGTLSGGVGILLNLLLSASKFLAGLITGSIAITADAFNNLSDAGSSVVTLFGFRMAGKRADDDHPFGHGRIEYLSGLVVAVAILLFAFSSIIGNYYYGEANIRFITPKKSVLFIYRLMVSGMVLFGALASLEMAWSLADITMAFMTICNLIAVSLLGRQAFLLLNDYVAQKRKGIKDPVFDKNRIPELTDKAECW